MTLQPLEFGRRVRLHGVDYRLERRGSGWVLVSDQAADGFTKLPFSKNCPARYIRPVGADERLERYRISHTGIYRKISVAIHQSNEGRVMAITKDPRAREDGFDGFERDEWVKLIPLDDPELRITTERTTVPAPWLTSDLGGRR